MNGRTIAVVLRYRDPKRAADWLCEALGFTLESTEEASPGVIDFIRLTYGPSTVLVCPQGDSATERAGPSETQTCYLTVENIAAHYETAKAEGALLERKLDKASDGSELYVCRDPEGHLWSIGTHDFGPPGGSVSPSPIAARTRGLGLGMLAFTAVVASALTAGAVLIVSAPATAPPNDAVVVATAATGSDSADPAEATPSRLIAKDREIGDLRDDLASLQREHVGQAATLQRIKSELDAAKAAQKTLEADRAKAQQEVERLAAEADGARKSAQQAEARLADLEKQREAELVTASTTKAQDASALDSKLAALKTALQSEAGARQKAEAELAAIATARSEAEAARDAALADRTAAATRLADIEKAKKDAVDTLASTRTALAKANAELASLEQSHRAELAEKDKRIAALETAKAPSSAKATPPAKVKAATRAAGPPHRKVHKAQAQAATKVTDPDETLDPTIVRRCGRFYYTHC
ncbi:MAG: VOC family protein [Hyphomicrobiaceae bacterium]